MRSIHKVPELENRVPKDIKAERFYGEKLKLAREAQGLSQADLTKAAGMSQGTISKFESGIVVPNDEQRSHLAAAVGVRPEFFGRNDYIASAGVGEMFHRRRNLGAKKLAKIHARMNQLRMAVGELLDSVDGPPADVPRFDRPEPLTAKEIENLAEMLRRRWFVPDGPIASVSQLLGRSGILLVPFDFDDEPIDAIGIWLPGESPLVFFNPAAPDDRLRFTLMHEVAHFCLHMTSTLDPLTKEIEAEADRFASAFLMPAAQITPFLRGLSITKLGALKLKWKCSMGAIIQRAKQLEVISSRTASELWRQMALYGYRMREPEQYDVHCEDPARKYGQLLDLHRQQLGYSDEELIRVADLVGEWAYRLLGLVIEPKLRAVR